MKNILHLVAIESNYSFSEIKEFIDIALVSSSYDIQTVLYLDSRLILKINSQKPTEIEQSVNMLVDFSVPIYSDQTGLIFGVDVKSTEMSSLKDQSVHHFIF